MGNHNLRNGKIRQIHVQELCKPLVRPHGITLEGTQRGDEHVVTVWPDLHSIKETMQACMLWLLTGCFQQRLGHGCRLISALLAGYRSQREISRITMYDDKPQTSDGFQLRPNPRHVYQHGVLHQPDSASREARMPELHQTSCRQYSSAHPQTQKWVFHWIHGIGSIPRVVYFWVGCQIILQAGRAASSHSRNKNLQTHLTKSSKTTKRSHSAEGHRNGVAGITVALATSLLRE
mmetsp:Transcript_947/g.1916  ORF Transcript_947/g.1916 Transcript_947/m.1916 type:complete len:234 (-) Transcript_947:516-1217(-)